MTITELTPDFSVSSQIETGDLAEIEARGFRSILCNRPDGESADQTEAATIGAAAERRGIAFAFVPVISGQINEENVADFKTAIDELPAPVLAYCRSGTRCRNLWILAQR